MLALAPLAAEITERYAQAFPDEQERYTPEWRQWCTHDNQHVLGWAIDAERGLVDLWQQISWLARVLAARDYPLDRLARSLELAADVLHERVGTDAARAVPELRAAAAKVRDDAGPADAGPA
ncbi:MAG TPA: hypothetical protein VNA28_04180 [Solirubrobacteraceae bacterium]|nr:hypothetical protein [Solirubrobacteraceae bacterium]